jgi:PAS domain-containing protein
VGRDITSQKETELELSINRDYLNLIFSSVKAGILIIDVKTHVIIDANPAAVKMIGTAEEQIVRKVCHGFICPAEMGKCPVTDLGLSVDNSEGLLLTANGEKRSIIKYVTPTRLHGRDCLLETFIDNTARKLVEEELQGAYSQLTATEKELKKKIEELQISKDKRNQYDHGTGS